MGFMGIESIGSSDNTSDFMSEIVASIKSLIISHMKEEGNQYNTPGFIDVALILKSMITTENEFHFQYEWYKEVWNPLHELLDENKESWNGFENFEELFTFVSEMKEESLKFG